MWIRYGVIRKAKWKGRPWTRGLGLDGGNDYTIFDRVHPRWRQRWGSKVHDVDIEEHVGSRACVSWFKKGSGKWGELYCRIYLQPWGLTILMILCQCEIDIRELSRAVCVPSPSCDC